MRRLLISFLFLILALPLSAQQVYSRAWIVDFYGQPTPANPPTNFGRVYFDQSSQTMKCMTSAGANCWGASGGSGTVTSVLGTANQITSDGSTTTPTLSIPSTFIAPGSIAATTTVGAAAGSSGSPSLFVGTNATGFWQQSSTTLSEQYTASNGSAGEVRFYAGTTAEGAVGNDSSANTTFRVYPTNGTLNLMGGQTTATSGAAVNLGNNGAGNGNFSGTSGTVTAVGIGVTNAGIGAVSFVPASGTANFIALNIHPTINQTSTSSGNYTGLLLNVVETSLKGTANKLLDLQSGTTGGTSRFSVDNLGNSSGASYISTGTTFTTNNGCTDGTNAGGATAGYFQVGSTSCTEVITMGNSATAPHGWSCTVVDITTLADVTNPHQTTSSATTATFVTGTVVSGDKIQFSCVGY